MVIVEPGKPESDDGTRDTLKVQKLMYKIRGYFDSLHVANHELQLKGLSEVQFGSRILQRNPSIWL